MNDVHLGHRVDVKINSILNNFLFDYRSTSHCPINNTPAKLFLDRELRTRFHF